MDGRAVPGTAPASPSGGPREFRERLTVDVVLRHPQRQRFRSAQDQPRIERAQDRARRVLNELQPLDIVVVRGNDDPPTLSLWPFRYLVVLWTTRSAPNSIGRCTHGLANVLSTTILMRCLRARARSPRRRSVSRITGLVGVSTNSIFVCGRIACSIGSSEDVST